MDQDDILFTKLSVVVLKPILPLPQQFSYRQMLMEVLKHRLFSHKNVTNYCSFVEFITNFLGTVMNVMNR